MGSGKSLAAKFFAEQGAHIIDADQLSRELVRPGHPALKEIVDAFGEDILEPSGNLDREALAKIIFDDTENKSCLLYTSPSPRDKRQSRMPSSA